MSVIQFLADVHGRALWVLTRAHRGQLQGLKQGERALRERICSRTRRRLIHLDIAFAICRDVTSEGNGAFVIELSKELGIDGFVGAQSDRDDEFPCYDNSVHGDDGDNIIADFLRGAFRGELGARPEEPPGRHGQAPEERAHRGFGTGGSKMVRPTSGLARLRSCIDGETSGDDDDAMPNILRGPILRRTWRTARQHALWTWRHGTTSVFARPILLHGSVLVSC